ncbi:hypothetical protein [Streptomyces europaeiscabiei]|uniref:hypothetical protein n=1 Tax=Streptomyces europaeiscabiei TaxID=146819 RepID=UPI002E11C531|nr:hypothetical protein OHB30_08910 [Streptomyces europaeiscabiei]
MLRNSLRRRDDGERLLAYWRTGAWHDVHADDLNAHPRERTGTYLTAKDFRTWHATVLAAVALAVAEAVAAESRTARSSTVTHSVREVAGCPGHTPAVCRASYISPRVIGLFEEGRTIAPALDALGVGPASANLPRRVSRRKRCCGRRRSFAYSVVTGELGGHEHRGRNQRIVLAGDRTAR